MEKQRNKMKKNIEDYQGEVRINWNTFQGKEDKDPYNDQGGFLGGSRPVEFVVNKHDNESKTDVRKRLKKNGSRHLDSVLNGFLDELCKVSVVDSDLNGEDFVSRPTGKVWLNDWRNNEEDNKKLVRFLKDVVEYVQNGCPIDQFDPLYQFSDYYFVEGSEQEKKSRTDQLRLIGVIQEVDEDDFNYDPNVLQQNISSLVSEKVYSDYSGDNDPFEFGENTMIEDFTNLHRTTRFKSQRDYEEKLGEYVHRNCKENEQYILLNGTPSENKKVMEEFESKVKEDESLSDYKMRKSDDNYWVMSNKEVPSDKKGSSNKKHTLKDTLNLLKC